MLVSLLVRKKRKLLAKMYIWKTHETFLTVVISCYLTPVERVLSFEMLLYVIFALKVVGESVTFEYLSLKSSCSSYKPGAHHKQW